MDRPQGNTGKEEQDTTGPTCDGVVGIAVSRPGVRNALRPVRRKSAVPTYPWRP